MEKKLLHAKDAPAFFTGKIHKKMKKALVFIDGGATGNPGEGGIGGIIYNEREEKVEEFSIPIGKSTNNQAEYLAMLYALILCKSLKFPIITMYTDSELLYSQWKGIYRVRNSRIHLYHLMLKLLKRDFEKVELIKVPREKNKEADKLVKKAFRKTREQTR